MAICTGEGIENDDNLPELALRTQARVCSTGNSWTSYLPVG